MGKGPKYHWTLDERQRFDRAFKKWGRKWNQVSQVMGTRSPTQCRSHGQKALSKHSQSEPAEVFPESERQVETACDVVGPFVSFGSQYGEDIRFLNVPLDEATWKERVSRDCELAEDLYDLKVPLPVSSHSVSRPEVRKGRAARSTEVRDVGTQWVECQSTKTFEQWYVHIKYLDDKCPNAS